MMDPNAKLSLKNWWSSDPDTREKISREYGLSPRYYVWGRIRTNVDEKDKDGTYLQVHETTYAADANDAIRMIESLKGLHRADEGTSWAWVDGPSWTRINKKKVWK